MFSIVSWRGDRRRRDVPLTPHPFPKLRGSLVAAALGPDAFALGLGFLFHLEKGAAIRRFQVLSIGLGHSDAEHFLVHVPFSQPEDGDHATVAVNIADLHPDGLLADQRGKIIPRIVAERLSWDLPFGSLRCIDTVEADLQLGPFRGDGLHGVAVGDPGYGGGDGTNGLGVAGHRGEDDQADQENRKQTAGEDLVQAPGQHDGHLSFQIQVERLGDIIRQAITT
jgi:hypothetical protein